MISNALTLYELKQGLNCSRGIHFLCQWLSNPSLRQINVLCIYKCIYLKKENNFYKGINVVNLYFLIHPSRLKLFKHMFVTISLKIYNCFSSYISARTRVANKSKHIVCLYTTTVITHTHFQPPTNSLDCCSARFNLIGSRVSLTPRVSKKIWPRRWCVRKLSLNPSSALYKWKSPRTPLRWK